MFSDVRYGLVLVLCLLCTACQSYRKIGMIRSGELGIGLSVVDERPLDDDKDVEVRIDSIKGTLADGPIIMNAIRDAETGEMVATDVINASKVTARFRNVAERAGYVSVSFDITLPEEMAYSSWQLKIRPLMMIQEDTVRLEPLYVTGRKYRAAQLRGYERYRQFLSTIVEDSLDFVRINQLEIFLERHFPQTYAMKNDSSFVPEPLAENLFGVTQKEALQHYTRHLSKWLNERRRLRSGRMFRKYVKDPIVREGVRLDTVLTSAEGDFVYRYVHTFRSRPKLKKVKIALSGSLYEDGEPVLDLPFPEELTFYISSLSTLVDNTPRYRMIVLERTVYDNTKALIDFRQGSAVIDTSLSDNASELKRIVRCIGDVLARSEYALDSLVIVASCSPEGAYSLNRRLSSARSESVRNYIGDHVPAQWKDSLRTSELPENWDQLVRLVRNDTVISEHSRRKIIRLVDSGKDMDEVERRLARLPEYRYMREKIYPALRSVSFDFYLHRIGMQKDTIHTTELDSVYHAGIEAMKGLDYKRAVTLLRPYGDYNAALAFLSADYNHSALSVLDGLDQQDAKVCYLKAMTLSRLGQHDEAVKYYHLSVMYDPYMEHRANLDPEMSGILKKDKP